METRTRKTALRMLTYGAVVLGLKQGDRYNASTVSWLSQCSFDPPLIMMALRNGSLTQAMVESAGQFVVNILAEGQTAMAAAFSRQADQKGGKLSGFAFEPGVRTGAPVLADVPAWLECKVTDAVKRGDHTIIVAEIVEVGVRDANVTPLALRDTPWHYGG
jgi:flavin reductase (DIM6/NTAB) family NADH-FMN oxidoreductase RutF